jgi:hypothetical protein
MIMTINGDTYQMMTKIRSAWKRIYTFEQILYILIRF